MVPERVGGYLSPGEYNLFLERTKITRLPTPYPSKCRENNIVNRFSSQYNLYSCEEECYFKNILNKCRDVPFKRKKYLKSKIKSIKSNMTKSELQECVSQNDPFKLIGTRQELKCECPPPCYEVQYHATWVENKHSGKKRDADFYIQVTYKNQAVARITEIPTSTIPQLLAEFGGILGLLSGPSALTIAELLFCVFITMAMYSELF